MILDFDQGQFPATFLAQAHIFGSLEDSASSYPCFDLPRKLLFARPG